jgi:L-asparaginase II
MPVFLFASVVKSKGTQFCFRGLFMNSSDVQPLVEVTRGPIVESIHFGSFVVVDAAGKVIASAGNPETMTYLRSSAKPFQVLPFVEQGGVEHFHLTDRELAIMCASHHGTDAHVEVLQGIHKKLRVNAGNLLCGMHTPSDIDTAERMFLNGEANSPLRHNCSGKHTGMLAACLLRGLSIEDYINPTHPIQQTIFQTFSEMTGVPLSQMPMGTDGCSAPVFAVPMRAAAWAFARLADPSALAEPRRSALSHIFRAMTSHPDMIAGTGAFDTELMTVAAGRILTKGGAEGYQAISVLPGACGAGSPAYGITIKIADGDLSQRDREDHGNHIANDGGGRARVTVALEILRELGALSASQIQALKIYDKRPQYNWRHIQVGEIRPCFELKLG